MLLFELCLLAGVFSGVAFCDDSFGLRLTTESLKPKESPQYSFHYFVKDDKTGDYKAQEETKKGNSVQGSYTIAEPNGDLRVVTYKAGPGTGFEAKVNVHPSGSPMKQFSGGTTARSVDLKTVTALDSKVQRFPGGFKMNITSPQSDVRTEMDMKFSWKTSPVTETFTDSTDAFTIFTTETAETTEAEEETTNTTANLESTKAENSITLTEGRDLREDSIKKEIDDAINSLPKLPEFVLSDDTTHFKLHKDPEEALLDERITQIARQLAETSLRREYEERKLGHFIPISVSSIETSPSDHLPSGTSGSDNPSFRPSEPSALHVLTQMKVIPEYIYGQTLIPRVSPLSYRLPGVSRTDQKSEEQNYHTTTDDIQKVEKSQTKDFNKIFKEKGNYITNEPTSVMPLQIPTFFRFFSPYVMHAMGSYAPQQTTEATTVKKDLTKGTTGKSDNITVYSDVTPLSKL